MILLQQRLVLAAASWNYKASGALLLLLIWNQKPRFKISSWKQSFLLKNENSETKISTILLHERKKKKKRVRKLPANYIILLYYLIDN